MQNTVIDNLFNEDMFAGFDFSNNAYPPQSNKVVSSSGNAPTTQVFVPGNPLADALAISGQAKLLLIRDELNDIYIERDHIVDDAMVALIVGQSMLLLGPPGTGKSAFVNELCSRIVNSEFFAWLMNRTSDPAEILGPFSLKAMEKDRFLRKTEGKLPTATIAFLDEIFKCNEPTLNILLSILNEKIFYNDGKAIPVPLISLFAASNETPEDDSLNALYDRLVFRIWVDYVKDPANKQKMYENYISKRNGNQIAKTHTTITLDELKALQVKAGLCSVDKNMYKVFIKLINVLAKDGIKISDRRQNECFKLMQGHAVYKGRGMVVLDDLIVLKHVLWEKKEDIEKIEDEIVKLINPFDDKIREIIRKFKEVSSNIDAMVDDNDKCRAAIEAKGSLEGQIKKYDEIIKEAKKNGKDVTDMLKGRDTITTFIQKLMEETMGFNLSTNDAGVTTTITMPF